MENKIKKIISFIAIFLGGLVLSYNWFPNSPTIIHRVLASFWCMGVELGFLISIFAIFSIFNKNL